MSRDAADALAAALARNAAVGNIKGRLYARVRGGECIEGSLRRSGASARQRREIARATRRLTGCTHIEVNDGATRRSEMASTMRAVEHRLRGRTDAAGLLTGREAAVLAGVVAAGYLVIQFAAVIALVAAAVAAVAVGAVLGYAALRLPDWSYVAVWRARRADQATALAAARQTWLAAVPAAGPIALGAGVPNVADEALRAHWTGATSPDGVKVDLTGGDR